MVCYLSCKSSDDSDYANLLIFEERKYFVQCHSSSQTTVYWIPVIVKWNGNDNSGLWRWTSLWDGVQYSAFIRKSCISWGVLQNAHPFVWQTMINMAIYNAFCQQIRLPKATKTWFWLFHCIALQRFWEARNNFREGLKRQ